MLQGAGNLPRELVVQAIDQIERKRAAPRKQGEGDDHRCGMEHQLLWHEVAIELEDLVWECDDDRQDDPGLYRPPD